MNPAILETKNHLTNDSLTNFCRKVKFLEPRIEEHFNPDRPKKSSAGKAGKSDANHRTLRQKLKKETRGAMKELRMDAKYLARLVV